MSDTPAPAPAPAPEPTPAPGNWYDGADAELIGHLQNRGLDKMTPAAAALSEAKAYREASKLLGAPPDSLLRMPKDAADKDGWQKVYDRMGVPATKDKYDFTGIKFADNKDLDPAFVTTLRDVAADLHLTNDAAKALAQHITKLIDNDEATDQAEYDGKLAVERDTLQKNWGSNSASNKVVAENAARALGVTQEELAALEKTVGYARTMEMFRQVGARIGEDKFIKSEGPAGGVMTVEQAKATLKSLQNDTVWVSKYEAGDIQAGQQFHNLTRLIAGV
jgi:hypothetical protein